MTDAAAVTSTVSVTPPTLIWASAVTSCPSWTVTFLVTVVMPDSVNVIV